MRRITTDYVKAARLKRSAAWRGSLAENSRGARVRLGCRSEAPRDSCIWIAAVAAVVPYPHGCAPAGPRYAQTDVLKVGGCLGAWLGSRSGANA